MAAKRHKKHKNQISGLVDSMCSMNKNKDSDFLRIHKVFTAGVFTISFPPVRDPTCMVFSRDIFEKYITIPKIFEKRVPHGV